MVVVLGISSGGVKRRFRLEREVTTLGRAEGCGIVLDDSALSRTHCQLERIGRTVYVRDLNSRNGTRLRGETVHRARLEPGDEVVIGTTRVVFEGVEEGVADPSLGLRTMQLLFGRGRRKETARDPGVENARLRQILELLRPIVEELDQDRVLERVIDTAVDLASAERGFLLSFRGKDLAVEVARNFWRKDVTDPEVEISHHIAEQVVSERRSLVVEDAGEDERFREFLSVHALRLRSVLCVPLLFRGEAKGVLYLDNRFTRGSFREEDKEVIGAFADVAAIALVNSGRFAAERRRSLELEEELKRGREDLLRTRQELALVERKPPLRHGFGDLVAESPAMRDLLSLLDRVIPTSLPVLLEGPAGTGKERIARLLHDLGPRQGRPFVVLSCAALPSSLAEVELFGHGRGAYTGAGEARGGLLDEAESGTLYLEGVEDLEPDSQALFLRVLESGEYRRVGETESRRADIRVVAGSRVPLLDRVRAGRFREDLYFRLKGVALRVPPLAERPEDLPKLLEKFMAEEAPGLDLTPRARKALLLRPWPGNLVEVRNEIRRLATLGERVVDLADLAPVEPSTDATLKDAVESLERRMIVRAMRLHDDNLSRAAEALGLSRLGLRNKLERYQLSRRRRDQDPRDRQDAPSDDAD